MGFTALSLQLLMLNWKFPVPSLVNLKSGDRAQGSPASLFCSYLVNWVNFTICILYFFFF